MRCEKCSWTPEESIDQSDKTRVMVDHFEDAHGEIFE